MPHCTAPFLRHPVRIDFVYLCLSNTFTRMHNLIQRFLGLAVMVLCLVTFVSAGDNVPLSNLEGKYKGEIEDHGGMLEVIWTIKKKDANSIVFTYGSSRKRNVTLTVQSNKDGVVTCTGSSKNTYSTTLYTLKYTDKTKTLQVTFGTKSEDGDLYEDVTSLTKMK